MALLLSSLYFFNFSKDVKEEIMSKNLESLMITPERVKQVLFSRVQMRYSKHLRSDVWFEMVNYISRPDDGVQKFLEKHRWLECFVSSSDTANTSDILEELQRAYSEFELNPTGFVNNIQSFSKLLCTRDLCKQLFSYFGEVGHDPGTNNDRATSFWIKLQAGIFDIMQSGGPRISSGIELLQWNRIQNSLDRVKVPTRSSADSSASNQLQECLNRFCENKERNRAAQGK